MHRCTWQKAVHATHIFSLTHKFTCHKLPASNCSVFVLVLLSWARKGTFNSKVCIEKNCRSLSLYLSLSLSLSRFLSLSIVSVPVLSSQVYSWEIYRCLSNYFMKALFLFKYLSYDYHLNLHFFILPLCCKFE